MGQVIVITSGKGGVGKTTTTANIGSALAHLGKRVVVMDADVGLRNLDVVMGLESRVVYNLFDTAKGTVPPRKALVKDKRFDNLYLLAASQTHEKSDITPEEMQRVVDALAAEFDFVLIDCPAGIEQGFKNAIAPAHRAVVVCNPEVSSVRDSDRVIGLWDAQRTDAEGKEIKEPAVLIINRIRPRMVTTGEMLSTDDILEMLGCPLLGMVPEDDHIIVSSNKGEPAVLNKDSKAGQAYLNIAHRLLGEDIPMMDLSEPLTLWGRIRRLMGWNG